MKGEDHEQHNGHQFDQQLSDLRRGDNRIHIYGRGNLYGRDRLLRFVGFPFQPYGARGYPGAAKRSFPNSVAHANVDVFHHYGRTRERLLRPPDHAGGE